MVVLYVENPSDCFQQLVEQEKLRRQFDFKSAEQFIFISSVKRTFCYSYFLFQIFVEHNFCSCACEILLDAFAPCLHISLFAKRQITSLEKNPCL